MAASATVKNAKDERPEFMVRLGLLPPYSTEDVKQAYLARARDAHPDAGGTVEQFVEVQQAYEQAQMYVEFRASRRDWIASRVERYAKTEEISAELRQRGARVILYTPDWLERSFGDFAHFSESIEGVILHDSADGDAVIDYLLLEHRTLENLQVLSLAGSRLTDAMVLRLRLLESLKHLDLSRTPITGRGARLVFDLPLLEMFDLRGTKIGRWNQWKVSRCLKTRQRAKPRRTI